MRPQPGGSRLPVPGLQGGPTGVRGSCWALGRLALNSWHGELLVVHALWAAELLLHGALHWLSTRCHIRFSRLLPATHPPVPLTPPAPQNALTRDAFQQLQTIASQQSKIREVKNKLAVFREALGKQEGSVAELLLVRRLPAAYKQCLAECVRRGAFMEKYAARWVVPGGVVWGTGAQQGWQCEAGRRGYEGYGAGVAARRYRTDLGADAVPPHAPCSAAKLAEGMGRFREKEVATRDAFRKHVER